MQQWRGADFRPRPEGFEESFESGIECNRTWYCER
jgi:hypothetical protein